jgi:hypothetical protein
MPNKKKTNIFGTFSLEISQGFNGVGYEGQNHLNQNLFCNTVKTT